ncbi:uncharacterized protein LOC111328468 [Stylophora pistillata]|uniref:uncharacterized protein LOC111328468 n=1 Tax=Stylophora pistillata TaxID=50429 RepID=UPI000C0569A2|nr:uncharacterized protein LOC111328468 [Stylophora pistillata]
MLARKSVIIAAGVENVKLVFGLIFFIASKSAGQEYTSSSNQVSNETADSCDSCDDDFYSPGDFDTLRQTLSPLIYVVIGGASVLGVILLTYACYTYYNRNSREQHVRFLATVPLPPQFPIGAAHIYRDDLRVTLVNDNQMA